VLKMSGLMRLECGVGVPSHTSGAAMGHP